MKAKFTNHRSQTKVAVIDNGVDYTHPDLINHIHFDRDSRKISGAGLDLWALDSWASPNTISLMFCVWSKGVLEMENCRRSG